MRKHPAKKRVLIVNRGEIAIRIARALREMGHTAVGVWTDNEQHAAHLEFCHEWIKLEGDSNKQTYLNIPQILKVAKEHQIDAIHPGYGFLSENGEFARTLEKEGIIFIGPNSQAIIMMGDKGRAKTCAKEAGVPVVPGSEGEVEKVQKALEISAQIGYPVLLKAVAGGGGKGMRICQDEGEVSKNFEVVKREAQAAFGYGGVMVEKFIVNPRHIEVQILGDKKGNIFHFYERECSVQRRYQKILEEAPSPFIGDDEKVRQDICQTALKLARAVHYDSAGTVEFIMGEDKKFYFLEMNTRIQVEHAITEEILGLDLMVGMIKAAFGEDLGISSQEEIIPRGHAIECRICAEDPLTMRPTPGMVTGFEVLFPQGIRFDHCLYPGLKVTPEFDPMVGKLVAYGSTRQAAMAKISAALDGLLIEGLITNIPLHQSILKNPNFVKGCYSTNFLDKEEPYRQISTEVDTKILSTKLALLEAVRMGL